MSIIINFVKGFTNFLEAILKINFCEFYKNIEKMNNLEAL